MNTQQASLELMRLIKTNIRFHRSLGIADLLKDGRAQARRSQRRQARMPPRCIACCTRWHRRAWWRSSQLVLLPHRYR